MTSQDLAAWRAENAERRKRKVDALPYVGSTYPAARHFERTAYSDPVEDRIDALLDEIERLRCLLEESSEHIAGVTGISHGSDSEDIVLRCRKELGHADS